MSIERPSQVWAADICYIPMAKGFLYLVAIMDWASRRVLAWRTSNTLTADFCVAALKKALARYGTREIFNTDQGSQFTGSEFTDVLKKHRIQISMDGKGRRVDNVYVKRLWRSLKYEDIYLKAYASIREAQAGIGTYFDFLQSGAPSPVAGPPYARPSVLRHTSTPNGGIMSWNRVSRRVARSCAWLAPRARRRGKLLQRSSSLIEPEILSNLTGPALRRLHTTCRRKEPPLSSHRFNISRDIALEQD